MSTKALTASPLEQFNSFTQLHFVRQIIFMLVIAAGIGLSTAVVLWSLGSSNTALYMDMSTQDTADVIAILEQNGTKYELENGIISVPADEAQEIRLLLANNGLPRSTAKGYGMLEEESALGTSNFIEEARFTRALEQELVQTVKRLRGVRDARVHLSIPKQTSFLRASTKPSASVMLDLVSIQALNDTQLAGVAHLVSSSVAGLEAENVSIVDQRGNLLSQNADAELNSSNENIRFSRNMEEKYVQRIIEILTPIVGEGNIHAQVSADLDFTIIETTEELYNPTTASIRSEQTQEEVSGTNNDSAVVPPGTLSPTPPDNEAALIAQEGQASSRTQSRTNSTRNFELDRTINHSRTEAGSINRLSVAVLVDLHPYIAPPIIEIDPDADPEDAPPPPPPVVEEVIDLELDQAKLDRITQLVQDTIGFDIARGDSVNVVSEEFYQPPQIQMSQELPIWQQSWVLPAAKQFGASLVVIYLLFGVLKPAMKSVVSNTANLSQRGLALAGGIEGELADQQSISGTGQDAALKAPSKSIYDENLQLAQELVESEPARAARMIKDWVADD